MHVSYPSLAGWGQIERREALVDSGSDNTTLPKDMCDTLGLRRVDDLPVEDGRSTSRQDRYAALIALAEGQFRYCAILRWDRPYALLGRDMLNNWKLVLDGPRQTLEVTT